MDEKDDAIREAHEPHEKALQLGVNPDDPGDRGEHIDINDEDAVNAFWADAVTVDEFKQGMDDLMLLDMDTVEALKQAREG